MQVKCIICGNMKQKKYTYVFDRRKYKKILNGNEKLEDILKDKQMKQYICKGFVTVTFRNNYDVYVVNLIMTHTYANNIIQVIMTSEILLY